MLGPFSQTSLQRKRGWRVSFHHVISVRGEEPKFVVGRTGFRQVALGATLDAEVLIGFDGTLINEQRRKAKGRTGNCKKRKLTNPSMSH